MLHSPQSAIHEAAPAVNPSRLMSGAQAEVLGSAECQELSALSLGCVSILVRSLVTEVIDGREARLEFGDAQACLLNKGVGAEDAALMISALQRARVIRLDAGCVTMEAVDRVAAAERIALANRRAGWGKRSRMSEEAASEARKVRAAPKPVTRLIDGVEYRRFAVTDAPTHVDSDPVVESIPCEGGRVAELTKSYLEHLQASFPSLDVQMELRRARLWAESNKRDQKTFAGLRRYVNGWMSRATERATTRKAVVESDRQRNGFGQGGGYPVAQTVQPDTDLVTSVVKGDDLGNDFSDLLPAAAPTTRISLAPMLAVVPAIEPPTPEVTVSAADSPAEVASQPAASGRAKLLSRLNQRRAATAAG